MITIMKEIVNSVPDDYSDFSCTSNISTGFKIYQVLYFLSNFL